jgi:hypothetical protein
MKLAQVQPGDLIEVDKRGRRMFGRVVEIEDALVRFEPLCPGISYRHASSREIIGHWRKAGRRSASPSEAPAPAREGDSGEERAQLALRIDSRR